MNPHIAGNYLPSEEDQQLICHEIKDLSPKAVLEEDGSSLLDIVVEKSRDADQYIASILIITPLAPIFTRCQSQSVTAAIKCSFYLMSQKLQSLWPALTSSNQPQRPQAPS